MRKINSLVILITPFHKLAVKTLFPELLANKNTLVLCSEYVEHSDIMSPKEKLINYDFSRHDLFTSPLKNFYKTKRKIAQAKESIVELELKYDISDNLKIVICSDKDIYTQLLLNHLYRNSSKKELIAIEEGLGFYIKTNVKDQLLSLTYKILTPLLFGSRLYYVRRLGIYPKINTIYIRATELLPKKINSHVKYETFKLGSGSKKQEVSSGSLLFFSFPNQDYNMSTLKKMELIAKIARMAKKNDKKLIIKPHPREDIEMMNTQFESSKDITIMDKSISGEQLDYFDYEHIINFFSSIMLDIIEKKYPKNRLLTIGVLQEPPIRFTSDLKYFSLRAIKDSDLDRFINQR